MMKLKPVRVGFAAAAIGAALFFVYTRRFEIETAGGDRVEILVSARREGSVTVIEVADSGPGVSEKARAHLFEAFPSVARKGGSGLGLAIAAELVQAQGGQIALVKNEGGATFRVTIPDVVVELERARRRRA